MNPQESKPKAPASAPPEASPAGRRLVHALSLPVERFLRIEAASGILLIIAAALALALANSPWSHAYEHLWHTPIRIGAGAYTFERDLHFWISDGLMVIFFFVVGLEIRREIHQGELSDLRRAALPVAGALGGMVAPALIYLAFNRTPATRPGWGIPMATDIAFAVGVLTLLGKRVPAALRIFLLALAVIDDLGAIVVIALFYSTGFAPDGLVIVAAAIGVVFLFQRLGFRQPALYFLPGIAVWLGLMRAGVHPTIGGVLMGALTPVKPWFGEEGFLQVATDQVRDVERRTAEGASQPHDLLGPLGRLKIAVRETVAPVVRLQAMFHPWVAYLIMPLFALANAGVSVRGVDLGAPGAAHIAAGAALGLLIGKPVGIVAGSLLAVKLSLCALPRGVGLRELVVAGCLGGIGFTMAIFVAMLAFPAGASLAMAKLAVLVGSSMAALGGLLLGRLLLPAQRTPDVDAITVDQAETSTEY